MKTAISIPDEVFAEAERVARRLGMSRSELFTKAVQAYLQTRRDLASTQPLAKPSVALVCQIASVDKSLFAERASTLPQRALHDLSRGMALALG